MGQHFNLFERYPDQLVVSNEMGSLEEVVTVSLAEMEEGEIVDHGDGDPDRINLFSVPVVFSRNQSCFGIHIFSPKSNPNQSKIPHGDKQSKHQGFHQILFFFLFSEEQIEKILDKATNTFKYFYIGFYFNKPSLQTYN